MIPASARSPSVPFHRNATDTPQGGGVQRDRVRHVARADHLHDERLASGLIEDVREAEREPERGDVPVLDPARRDERPEQEGLAGERRLRGDEQGALRQPVGHRAGDDGEHEDRRELQGGDEPEPERGVRELQHEPRLRDRLHPAPHQRQELGDVKAAEIAVIERAQRVGKRHPTPRREPWPSCAPILPSRVLPLRSRMRRATLADTHRTSRLQEGTMALRVMSADSHMDLIYLPPDTFTSRMAATSGGTVPRVVERDGRKWWVSGDAVLGPYGVYGPGVTGGKRGRILAEAGFATGKQTRPSNPVERREDQQRDGVEAEVIYGIIGVSRGLFTHAGISDRSEERRVGKEWCARWRRD